MTRWVTFDGQSAAHLRATTNHTVEERTQGDALTAALACDDAVALLPGGGSDNDALLITVHRCEHAQQPEALAPGEVARWSDPSAKSYAAGGFLGLLDEPVYEDEQPQKPKSWWKKVIG